VNDKKDVEGSYRGLFQVPFPNVSKETTWNRKIHQSGWTRSLYEYEAGVLTNQPRCMREGRMYVSTDHNRNSFT